MALFKKLVLILLLLAPISQVYAVDTCPSSDPQTCVDFYNKKVSETRGQAETLAGEISHLDNQIALTQSRINLTENKLGRVDGEIASISGRLSLLNETLNHTSEVLLNRIVNNYKAAQNDGFLSLITSPNLNTLVSRAVYLKIVQKHDQKLLEQMTLSKKNYSDQKALLQEIKKKQEDLKKQLNGYKLQMDGQKRNKDRLLAVTQNDEIKYSQLLNQAKAQLAAFSGFISNQGGLNIIDADSSWPKDYYSQRDRRWANVSIAGYYPPGAKIYSIGEAGCLISSVAMVRSYRGNSDTPRSIGTNYNYFFNAYFQWSGLIALGFNTPQRTLDRSNIDNRLNQGKRVIVGLSYFSNIYSEPFHFVVIIGKDGNDYKIYDPWRGPNISYNGNYGAAYITEIIAY